MKGDIEEIFSRMLWDPRERREDYEVIFVSRGRPGDIESATGKNIKVLKGALEVRTGWETKYIPFHRIVAIIRRGEPIWISPRWRHLLPEKYQQPNRKQDG